MNYTVIGNRNRHFELFDNNNTSLGTLAYNSWFGRSAIIELYGGVYEITAVGFWQNTTEIRQNGALIGSLKYKFGKGVVVTMENGRSYTFKRVGFFNFHYGVLTENEQEIIALKPQMKLLSFTPQYTIETDDNYTKGKDVAMLLFMVYCANYMRSMAAAAAV